jgi:hypothetical protein
MSEKKDRDVPGWIQVLLGVLGFFGIGSAAVFGFSFDKSEANTPATTSPTVAVTPGTPTSEPTTSERRTTDTSPRTRTSPRPAATTDTPVDETNSAVVGDWTGSSQLSAYESTSLSMTLSLSADGRYSWERDVIHDSGYWEVQGDYIAFEQDSGGQYAWPYRLSGSGSRQVLTLVTEQGGTTKLHRVR